MEFFTQAVDVLNILVMALGVGLASWGAVGGIGLVVFFAAIIYLVVKEIKETSDKTEILKAFMQSFVWIVFVSALTYAAYMVILLNTQGTKTFILTNTM